VSLQRRLLLYLLICAPVVWAAALVVSIQRARHEVNELFDTELIRLARQVQATLHPGAAPAADAPGHADAGDTGAAEVEDLGVAAWDGEGRLLLADREGALLPRHAAASGFQDLTLAGQAWRVYYLRSSSSGSSSNQWLVAAGQKVHERDEIVFGLTYSQFLSWLLMLPVLLAAMAWAVRRALVPLRQLAADLHERSADDLRPVPAMHAPAELQPAVAAMNGLFTRIEEALARERRFTADAAHELRTPLAVLRAQWDVLRGARTAAEREAAEVRLGLGLDRLDRLVTQMLALSRVEAGRDITLREVRWTGIVEQAMSDCLPLAERRRIDLACEWPDPAARPGALDRHPLPLVGDEHLLTVMLRNLLDNAVRYAPAGTQVVLRLDTDQLSVENEGAPLPPDQLARLGERFFRPDGQEETGSGLGVSIVQRIASLHGLLVRLSSRADGQGMRVVVAPA
jgi:two-component system sensor histidine kinase QseC